MVDPEIVFAIDEVFEGPVIGVNTLGTEVPAADEDRQIREG